MKKERCASEVKKFGKNVNKEAEESVINERPTRIKKPNKKYMD